MVGFGNELEGLKIDNEDQDETKDNANAIIEALEMVAKIPEFEFWPISDLVIHTDQSTSKIIGESQAREVLFSRLIDLTPNNENLDKLKTVLVAQLDTNSKDALTARMMLKSTRLYSALETLEDKQKLIAMAWEHRRFLLPYIVDEIYNYAGGARDPQDAAQIVTATRCDQQGLSQEANYTCSLVYRSFGEPFETKTLEFVTKAAISLESNPLVDLDEINVFLLRNLTKFGFEELAELGYNSIFTNWNFSIQFIADILYSFPKEQLSKLEVDIKRANSMIDAALERIEIMRLYDEMRRSAGVSSEEIAGNFTKLLHGRFSESHHSYFSGYSVFTAKCFNIIADRVNEIVMLAHNFAKPPSCDSTGLSTMVSKHVSISVPKFTILPSSNHLLIVQSNEVPNIKDLSRIRPLIHIDAIRDKFTKLSALEFERQDFLDPTEVIMELVDTISSTYIDSPRLTRKFKFEIIRNSTTLSPLRFRTVKGLIVDGMDLAIYNEPYPLSWFGSWPSRLPYRDLFQEQSTFELLPSAHEHPFYNYWVRFFARAMAEFYEVSELKLHVEFLKSGDGKTMAEFLNGDRGKLLSKHRQDIKDSISGLSGVHVNLKGEFQCQVADELNDRWHGLSNVDFVVPCSTFIQSQIDTSMMEATTTTDKGKVAASKLRASNYTTKLVAMWKSTFTHITKETLLEAIKNAPIDIFSTVEEIPFQSDLWDEMPSVFETLDDPGFDRKREKIFELAMKKATTDTPWVGLAVLKLGSARKSMDEFRKPFETTVSNYLVPLSDPSTPHSGIKKLRKTVHEIFKTYPSWMNAKDSNKDKALISIREAMALCFFEAIKDEDMVGLRDNAKTYMTQGATKAVAEHWERYLRNYIMDAEAMIRPVIEQLETEDHWRRMLDNVKIDDAEIMLRNTVDERIAKINALCGVLNSKLTKPDCNTESPFFHAVRLLAVLDIDAPLSCLVTKFNAFKMVGTACNVTNDPSADPLEKLRGLELEVPTMKPTESEPSVTPMGMPGEIVKIKVVAVDGFWPARTIRTLKAAFFVLFLKASKNVNINLELLRAKNLEGLGRLVLARLNSYSIIPTDGFLNLLMRPWHTGGASYGSGLAASWKYFQIRWVPLSAPLPPYLRNKIGLEQRLVFIKLEEEKLAWTRETFEKFRKPMDTFQEEALSVTDMKAVPTYPSEFEDAMMQRYETMVDEIEDDTYRKLLAMSRSYGANSDRKILRLLLEGPGRMASMLSRLAGTEKLWTIIMRLPRTRKFDSNEELVATIKTAFLSYGATKAMQSDIMKQYPGLYQEEQQISLEETPSSSGGPPPAPTGNGPPPAPTGNGPPPAPTGNGPPPAPTGNGPPPVPTGNGPPPP